jgi:tRNA(Glu) U13 pseudouridine synthase TruD
MRQVNRCYEVLLQLNMGQVYSWEEVMKYSKSPSRDVKRLLDEGKLEKVGPGLYSPFKVSRFGKVPPDERDIVKAFLKSDDFLMFSVNLYNSLGLGLTQLKNETVVYNKKRYELVVLLGREFNFKRPNNGYPDKLTKEFLLVDLMNNLKSVGEEPSKLKEIFVNAVVSNKFNLVILCELSNKYGKVSTKKFFNDLFIKIQG